MESKAGHNFFAPKYLSQNASKFSQDNNNKSLFSHNIPHDIKV